MDQKTYANRVIDALGGTSEAARLCEIAPASVSEWRGKYIPKSRLMFLRLARPEIFVGNLNKEPMPNEQEPPKTNRAFPREQLVRETSPTRKAVKVPT